MSIDEFKGRRQPNLQLVRDASPPSGDRSGDGVQDTGQTPRIAAGEDVRAPQRGGRAAAGDADAARLAKGEASGAAHHLTKRQKRRRRSKSGGGSAAVAQAAAEVSGNPGAVAAGLRAGAAPVVLPDAGPAAGAQKPRRRRRRSPAVPGTARPEAVTASKGALPASRARRQGDATTDDAAGSRSSHSGASQLVPSRASLPNFDPPAFGEEDRGRPPVYAALDLGTNNCRLLVAVPTRPGQFRVIDAFSRIVRLGEGLSRTGRLAAPAMDRAIAALAICSQKLAARRVAGSRLIATEACRAAVNGEEFIERVRIETGLDLEIVSRETEARLAVSGCGSLVDRSAQGAVLFDIGGGSSEIALLDLRDGYTRKLSQHIVAWTSLPVGVVTLAERYGGRDVTPALFEAMTVEVQQRIGDFNGRDRLRDLVGGEHFHLLGTSGTVTTLAGVHLKLDRYDRRQVDGLWLNDAEVSELVARIAGWSFEERVANPCIGGDRADLVLAGCAILEGIRRTWPARTLRVADRGLREGLLTEMMVADGVWRKGAQTRQKAFA